MAVILFGQQAQQQKGQQSEATYTYEEFVGKATGRLNLRGQYLVDENGLRVNAKAFLEGVLNDDITLTPCTRYQDEGNGAGAFVSPLTRGRNTGWAFGNAFISVNTMVGLISPGLQLPEYRATRANPRPTNGQVGDEMWIIGPWAARDEFKLYVTDGKEIEPLESWITRKLQSVN
jgi:hypothetical protein